MSGPLAALFRACKKKGTQCEQIAILLASGLTIRAISRFGSLILPIGFKRMNTLNSCQLIFQKMYNCKKICKVLPGCAAQASEVLESNIKIKFFNPHHV